MDAWLSGGLVRLVLGDWNLAVEHFARAMRLSPFDPMLFMMQAGTASGHFYAGHYEEAAMWSAKSIGENPKVPAVWRVAAASNAWLDRQEQAQNAISHLRRLEPTLRISNITHTIPTRPSTSSDEGRLAKGRSA